jgi:cell wall-associated NlpC family hydrolase
MSKMDSRLNACRPDLADIELRGKVEAKRFVEGEIRQVIEPIASIHREPRFDSMQTTQVLMGERVRVFECAEGWAWVKLETDGYVGYISANALAAKPLAATHRVAVPLTFAYPAPNIKAQPVVQVTLNAQLHAVEGDEKFLRLANNRFIFTKHVKPLDDYETDFVAVAERFLHVPYFWGGKSVLGLDCSGLVQLSLEAAGRPCPRDSDMQEQTLGQALPSADLDRLRRGDLVFWNGHVGIMTDASHLLHANGFYMQVTHEPLRVAVERIAASYGKITSIKRLQ